MRLIDAVPIMKFIQDGLNEKDPQKHIGYDGIRIMTEIEYAPTVRSAPVWTPCSEGLPESDQWGDDGFRKTYRVTVETDAGNLCVLLGNPYRYVTTASFELGEWILDSEDDEFDESDKVIAWQNQPLPYRADDTTGRVKEDT